MTLLLALLAATIPPGGFVVAGDDRKAVEVVCPVDGHRFTAYEVTSNEWGGKDLDFCPHAVKTTPLELKVWVCPSCAFAGLKKDFDAKLTDDEKKKLKEGLKPQIPIKKGARQTEVPGHVKYDLYAQGLALRGAPPGDVGRAYLYASWSARQQGAVYLDDFDEWETLRGSYGLNQTPLQLGKKNRTEFELEAAKKLEKDLESKKYASGINRTLSRYLAAYLQRKHGENAGAERWLKELEGLKGENSVVDDAAARMRVSLEQERGYQKKALERYTAEIERGRADPRSLGEMAYLAGELQRRLGDPKAAADWYQKAIDLTDSEPLRKLAGEQKSKLR